MDTLHAEYDAELATIKKEFDDERDLVEGCHKDEIQRLQDVLFAMEQNHQEKEAEARQDFQSMRDEIKNKVVHIHIIHKLYPLNPAAKKTCLVILKFNKKHFCQ